MGTREAAIADAMQFFDGDGFRERLSALVAIPSTSQEPEHEPDVRRFFCGRFRPDPVRRTVGRAGPADGPDLPAWQG
jgi:hypothetical protein